MKNLFITLFLAFLVSNCLCLSTYNTTSSTKENQDLDLEDPKILKERRKLEKVIKKLNHTIDEMKLKIDTLSKVKIKFII